MFDGMKEIRGKYLNLVQVPHSSLRDMHAHYVAHLNCGAGGYSSMITMMGLNPGTLKHRLVGA